MTRQLFQPSSRTLEMDHCSRCRMRLERTSILGGPQWNPLRMPVLSVEQQHVDLVARFEPVTLEGQHDDAVGTHHGA